MTQRASTQIGEHGYNEGLRVPHRDSLRRVVDETYFISRPESTLSIMLQGGGDDRSTRVIEVGSKEKGTHHIFPKRG